MRVIVKRLIDFLADWKKYWEEYWEEAFYSGKSLVTLLCCFLAYAMISETPMDLSSRRGRMFFLATYLLVVLILIRLWIKLFPDSKLARKARAREEAWREARRKER